MTLSELERLKDEDIIEVDGTQLGFQVSLLSNKKYEKEQEECLLESYYEFLNQSKKNGFMTQYIEMSVNRALRIFKNIDSLDAHCFRKTESTR